MVARHHLFQYRANWEFKSGLIDHLDANHDAIPIALDKICNFVRFRMLYLNIIRDAIIRLELI